MPAIELTTFVDVLCILAADKTNGSLELNNHFLTYVANTARMPPNFDTVREYNKKKLNAQIEKRIDTTTLESEKLLAAKKHAAEQEKREQLFREKLPSFNMNTRDSKKIKAVEAAASSGSVNSLNYLIENQKADITANDETRNLLEFAINNAEVKSYLLNPEKKRWQRFNDGTSDFLAHVAAGRTDLVKDMFAKNNNLICDSNLRYQNAFYWAHITQNQAMKILLQQLGRNYVAANVLTQDWGNLANYYACMGHYHAKTQENTQLALSEFEKSISFYTKTKLYNQLADVQRHCGNLHAANAKKMKDEAAVLTYQTSIKCYKRALANFNKDLSNKLPFQDKKIDSILRNIAECYYELENIYMTRGDNYLRNLEYGNALEGGYEPAAKCGEEALAAVAAISHRLAKDQKSLTDCSNLLVLTTGICSQLHSELEKGDGTLSEQAVNYHHMLSQKYLERRNSFLPEEQEENVESAQTVNAHPVLKSASPTTVKQAFFNSTQPGNQLVTHIKNTHQKEENTVPWRCYQAVSSYITSLLLWKEKSSSILPASDSMNPENGITIRIGSTG
jgi:hypothetical protein